MRFILLMPKGDTAQSIGWCFCIPYSCVSCDSAPVLFERKVNLAEKRIRKMTANRERNKRDEAEAHAYRAKHGRTQKDDENGKIGPKR